MVSGTCSLSSKLIQTVGTYSMIVIYTCFTAFESIVTCTKYRSFGPHPLRHPASLDKQKIETGHSSFQLEADSS